MQNSIRAVQPAKNEKHMSDRYFRHQLRIDDLIHYDGVISLTTRQIAEAAIQEIIQLSLSASPFDLFLEQLLNPATDWFQWNGTLGQIRETRTALSGLFGRFIARAYLTGAWGFTHFHPLRAPITPIASHPSIVAFQTIEGDLPDWLIAPDVTSSFVAIAEAKGSHNTTGPSAPLKAAKEQARRVSLFRGGTELVTKRFAVATRWAVHGNPKLSHPWLVVDDPEAGKMLPAPADYAHMRRGIALGHYAALARGLGLPETEHTLLTARNRPPGLMELPAEDLVSVERPGDQTWLIAGIFARSAIMPIPLRADALDLDNLAEAFDGQAMLVGISKDRLIEADRIGLSDRDRTVLDDHVQQRRANFYFAQRRSGLDENITSQDLTSPEETRDRFWRERRHGAGGFEFIPLQGLRLRRLQLKS